MGAPPITAISAVAPPGGCKVLVASITIMATDTASAAAKAKLELTTDNLLRQLILIEYARPQGFSVAQADFLLLRIRERRKLQMNLLVRLSQVG